MTVQQHYEQALAEAYNFREFMELLKSYAQQCYSVTEFGVHKGNSTWALLAGGPWKMTSYDIAIQEESGHGAFASTVEAAREAVAGSHKEFRFICGDSAKVDIEETDLLFIDSLHTFDHLTAELTRHHKKVNRFIILHDTTTFGSIDETMIEGTLGLWPAVERFLAEHPEWILRERLTIHDGLTILERK